MQHGGYKGILVALAAAAAVTFAAPSSFAKVKHHATAHAPTPHELKEQARVRREMRVAMHRERLRHRARMQEIAHRERMAKRAKDLDEQQRVRDLAQGERLLFAQRMRDIRSKAPEAR
jgi:hypothetical protein